MSSSTVNDSMTYYVQYNQAYSLYIYSQLMLYFELMLIINTIQLQLDLPF